MITASEYRTKNIELLTEYERRVRRWLVEDMGVDTELAERIPFFRDGVVCPEKWFSDGNDFRPLFIVKEVSLGKDEVSELDGFLNMWGHQTCYGFAENPFDDIQVGRFVMWRKIAALAKGMEEVHNGKGIRPYNIREFSYQEGELYKGSIKGYLDYHARTANSAYNDIIQRIAVIEAKKIGGGRTAGSNLSKATIHYSAHVEPFKDLICQQIELIDPTVIICCSREFFTWRLLASIQNATSDRKWIYGYHPTMSSILNFYTKPLRKYEDYCHNKR